MKPWEQYQQQAKPWEQYQAPDPTLGEQLQERGIKAMQEVAADKPAATLPFRLATQVGGAVGDITGAGLSAITPDVIEEPIKEYAGKAAQYLAGTKAGQAIGKGAELAQEYAPDVVDVGMGAMSLGAMPVGAQVAGKGALKGATKLEKAVNVKDIFPTAEGIEQASKGLYKKAQEMGADFSSDVLDDVYKAGQKNLPKGKVAQQLIAPDDADKFVESLKPMLGQKPNLDDFADIDRYLGDRAAAAYVSDKGLSRKFGEMQNALRESIESPANVVGEKAGIQAHREATRLWGIKRKLEEVERAIDIGTNNYAVPATGIKSQFTRLKNNKKLMRGFTKAEQKAIRQAADTGELFGIVKSGIGSRLNILAGMTGGPGMAAAMTGVSTAGRKGAEYYAARQGQKVAEMLGKRSGLVKQQRRIDPKKIKELLKRNPKEALEELQ